ncbi:MAG: DMT family transporter [Pseudomonadota bacterium]
MDAGPLLLALLAAALFGVVPHIQRAALPFTDVRTGALITIATFALLCWGAAPWFVDHAWWGTKAALIFALCGLFFPAFSQTLTLKSVIAIGPNLSSSLGSVAPLFAALFAIAFLGESLGVQGALGMALLVVGLSLAALGPKGGAPRAFALWALFLPIGASFLRGIAQAVSKLGFTELPSPFFATLVMATVSVLVLALPFLRPAARAGSKTGTRGNLLFAVNGLAVGGGIFALNAAISGGAVTVAAPLASTAPLWTFVYGLVFFRTETLSLRLLAVSVVVVLGCALIVTR